ncbi:CmlA/FloR family chloramphenicol efflux MFS transporter [Xenorhabdus bovienii]|uniref:Bcr/CflA family efflux transporter n=1 Tax=Xenorhabdus bovienii str. kraussei Becker Underwood TaxID=1398204 RepID=A0A077PVV1_XENBV|nr:CmlA/FloR family chloramphenicol efflux MFS transporter [Xenorhabdus bovienii]CDH24847.1 Chloramphenicol resistance protein [Xenorhabdus bovienii str. kraussei Becker Underwood]
MHSKDFSWRYSLTATILLLSPFDLLASLGMDMYLPVVPFIADVLGAGAGTIQLTLTAYLVLLGAGQLLFGPLSDRLGRRPVLLSGGIAYIVASFGLTVASSPEIFLSFRVIQACGASACLVATFATVRDIYSGREESNIIYGLLSSMLAMVPAVGPLLGVLVDTWLGWRAIFGLLGGAMTVAVIAAWHLWPETRWHRKSDLQWSQLLLPVKRLNFWLYTLCYSAGMGSFFVFLSTAPWLMMGRQGLSQLTFSLLFATVAIAMMVTSWIVGGLVVRWGSLNMLRAGMCYLMAGALLLAVGETLIPKSVFGFIVPMWLVGVGIATAVSVAPNGALRGFDHMAGTATAVYFCLGGLLLGGSGTLAITLLSSATAWPIIAYCLILATAVLCLSCFNSNRCHISSEEHDALVPRGMGSSQSDNRGHEPSDKSH